MITVDEIDEKISTLSKEILLLRRQRNGLVAIPCRLPPELLIRIFKLLHLGSYIAEDDPTAPLGGIFRRHLERNATPDLSWVQLMATCTHLRETALDTPELWRYIRVPGNRDWRELCRERRRQLAPVIYACYQPDNKDASDAVAMVATYLPTSARAYLRQFVSFDDPGAKGFTDTLRLPCADLEHLDLHAWALKLDHSFFGGISTMLTSLVLVISGATSWPLFPNLCHLMLKCDGKQLDHLQANELLAMLNNSSSLRVLSLDLTDIGEVMENRHDRFTTHAKLFTLHVLQLRCTPFICRELMRCLHLGPHVSGLDVSISSPIITPLLSSIDHIYEEIIQYTITCAKTYNLHEPSQSLRISLVCSKFADSFLYLGSSSPNQPVDIERPFCSLSLLPSDLEMPSLMNSVEMLHLIGDRTGPTASTRRDGHYTDEMIIERMDHLNTIIVDEAGTNAHISDLSKWISQRTKEDRPIRKLQIRNPANEKAKKSLETMCSRLKRLKHIEEVEWL